MVVDAVDTASTDYLKKKKTRIRRWNYEQVIATKRRVPCFNTFSNGLKTTIKINETELEFPFSQNAVSYLECVYKRWWLFEEGNSEKC